MNRALQRQENTARRCLFKDNDSECEPFDDTGVSDDENYAVSESEPDTESEESGESEDEIDIPCMEADPVPFLLGKSNKTKWEAHVMCKTSRKSKRNIVKPSHLAGAIREVTHVQS